MNYKLSKEADNDLIDLYLYGFKNFGESQAEQYFFEIEDCIKLLSETPLICRERTEFTPAENSSSWKPSHYLPYPDRSYFSHSNSS